MNKEDFLRKMQDILQTEEELSFETILDDMEEWDSLSAISTVAFLDSNFDTKITVNDLKEVKTIADIARKAGI